MNSLITSIAATFLFVELCASANGAEVFKAQQLVDGEMTISSEQMMISKETFADCDEYETVIGIRDFVWLLDEHSNVVQYNGEYVAFSNVFKSDQVGPDIYMYTSNDAIEWVPHQVEIPTTQGMDECGTSIGSALLVDHEIRLYYSGLTERDDGQTVYYTYNVTKSTDGLHYDQGQTMLVEDDFQDARHIGLPYTIYGTDGKVYMTCESISRAEGQYNIYGAVSDDGYHFTPLNGGKPVLENNAISWGDGSCANPKLHALSDDKFLLGFNAYPDGRTSSWRIGTALVEMNGTHSKVTKICDVPLIDNTDEGRIESAILESPTGRFNMIYYFKTPTHDARQGAAIYTANITCDE